MKHWAVRVSAESVIFRTLTDDISILDSTENKGDKMSSKNNGSHVKSLGGGGHRKMERKEDDRAVFGKAFSNNMRGALI
jgi:hypothetical protein